MKLFRIRIKTEHNLDGYKDRKIGGNFIVLFIVSSSLTTDLIIKYLNNLEKTLFRLENKRNRSYHIKQVREALRMIKTLRKESSLIEIELSDKNPSISITSPVISFSLIPFYINK